VREGRDVEFGRTVGDLLPGLISLEDLVGTIHIHTTFSDGKSSLEDMARAAQKRGFAWIGISDHSRSAYYAGGLIESDLLKQFAEIDRLNAALGGITLLKGIESDILADGALDYPPEILSRLDFVIASVHSHMDMDAASMTERIIRAIRNPRTSILGHVTGRVLLSRQPYELDLEKVLMEAARCRVAIELNANPQRLDIDWRLIEGFVSLGGRVIIGPDAHVAGGLDDVVYGVALARKGLLTKDACLNTLQADRLKEVFASRWK
ncbi:MAG TPA: PHP domain-containing protein, partial [Deltaproteobacteria bacterium]|nr:PHP domain-containing protein [Deltaproteobacteria bacterium]